MSEQPGDDEQEKRMKATAAKIIDILHARELEPGKRHGALTFFENLEILLNTARVLSVATFLEIEQSSAPDTFKQMGERVLKDALKDILAQHTNAMLKGIRPEERVALDAELKAQEERAAHGG